MGMTIRGIRVDSLSFSRTEDDKDKLTGKYSLMSNNDKVLATQGINGYSDIKVAFSATTLKTLNQLVACAKADIEGVLGLDDEKEGG